MAQAKALSEGEILRLNLASFKAWCAQNKGLIKAAPGKSVVYAGGKLDVNTRDLHKKLQEAEAQGAGKSAKAATKGSQEVLEKFLRNTKMWQVLKGLAERDKKRKLDVAYQTLEDVLQNMRSHPVFKDRDQVETDFANMYEYMTELEKLPKLFPKSEIRKGWETLSSHYAANAEGDIAFFDGVTADYKALNADFIFVEHELEALLSNACLSDASKKILDEKIGKYLKRMSGETRKAIKAVLNERKRLAAGS